MAKNTTELGLRVMALLIELEDKNDSRHTKIKEVLETTRKSHPGYNPKKPEESIRSFEYSHRQVAFYVENHYPDLYRRFFLTGIENFLPKHGQEPH